MTTTDKDWPWMKAKLEALGYFDLKRQGRLGRLEGVSLRTSSQGPVRRLAAPGRTKEQVILAIIGQAPFPVRREAAG